MLILLVLIRITAMGITVPKPVRFFRLCTKLSFIFRFLTFDVGLIKVGKMDNLNKRKRRALTYDISL